VARTLMAWIRTAVSLITFGFTIYKAFQYLREHGFGSEADSILGPRALALLMISMGLSAQWRRSQVRQAARMIRTFNKDESSGTRQGERSRSAMVAYWPGTAFPGMKGHPVPQ
jgi:uncharacterized membrane protein YidH (DUF202 family)